MADRRANGGTRSEAEALPVSFRGATKRYPGADAPAVDDLTLDIEAGEICVLVGPSGCGKTTAMRMVNRMVEITEGDILVGGTSVSDRTPAELRREIGYVIQQIGLFPHRTIAENIATVPGLLGWDAVASRRTRRRADEPDRPRPRAGRPLPVAALRRPAAARRRGAGAGGGPRGDADGRALRRGRPDQPRASAERVPAPAGRAAQDDPVRHPRHRRGDQDGRPDRRPAGGRKGRAVRDAGRAADGARRTTSSRTSSAPTARSSAWRCCGSPTSTSGRRRWRSSGQATAEVRAKLEGAEVPHALVVDSERRPLGWLSDSDLARDHRPRAPRRLGRRRRSSATTSSATRSRTCSRPRPSTRRSSTTAGRSRGSSRWRSSPSSSPPRTRWSRSTRPPSARWSEPMYALVTALVPLAQIGDDFFKDRSEADCISPERDLLRELGDRQHRPLSDARRSSTSRWS